MFEKVVERDCFFARMGKPQQPCESWPTMQKTVPSLEAWGQSLRSTEGSISFSRGQARGSNYDLGLNVCKSPGNFGKDGDV